MAQTKTRGSGKGPSAPTRSRSRDRSKSQSRSQSRSTKPKPSSTSSKTKVSSASNGLRDIPQTVEKTGKKAAHNVGEAASKARVPLLAGSAALAGAAGGLALGAMHSHRSTRKLVPKPLQGVKVKVSSEDVAKTARRIGAVSQHVADLTGEMNGQRAGGRRKSPVEVLLESLTARR